MFSMANMGMSLASRLPSGVKSKMYTTGLALIPPPYNILFDNLCFVYRHLDGQTHKTKLQEKINKLIAVAPIPSKSELTASVKIASDVCEFKDMVILAPLKEKMNMVMPKIYAILDKIILIAPNVKSNMNAGELKQLMDEFSGLVRELRQEGQAQTIGESREMSPATPATVADKFKKIEENIYKLKSMKGGTGLFIENDQTAAFTTFIENGTFTYLAAGSNGFILKGVLNHGIESPYKSMEDERPVNQILLKLAAINIGTNANDKYIQYAEPNTGRKQNITFQPVNRLVEEINIQTNVYIQSSEYLQPICPAILHSACIPSSTLKSHLKNLDAETNNMINAIFATSEDEDENLIEVNTKNKAHYAGLIAMEYMENMIPLHKMAKDNTKVAMGMYLLIQLAVKYGYFHGDFHSNNVMIDIGRMDYFEGMHGYPILIDFGYTAKLSPKIYKRIKDLYEQKKYMELVNVFCDIPRRDWLDLNDYPHLQLLCGRTRMDSAGLLKQIGISEDDNKYIKLMNTLLGILHKNREKSIAAVIAKTQISMPDIKLPLTATVKNRMYNGMQLVVPIVHLTMDFNVAPNRIKIVINWLYRIIIKHDLLFFSKSKRTVDEYITDSDTPDAVTPYVSNIIKLERAELNKTSMRIFIRMCYMFVHILNVEKNIPIHKIQLLGCVAFLLSEFSFLMDGSPMDSIVGYNGDTTILLKDLYINMNKYFPIVSNVEYDSIDRYFSLTKLIKLSHTELIDLMGNPDIYTNAKSIAADIKAANKIKNITRRKKDQTNQNSQNNQNSQTRRRTPCIIT